MEQFFKRWVDRPFLGAASALVRAVYRSTGLSPVRFVFFWMLLCGVVEITMGAALLATGDTGDMILGVTFVASGVLFAVLGNKASRTIPNRYDAGVYRSLLTISALREDARMAYRMANLAGVAIFGAALGLSLDGGSLGDRLIYAGFLAFCVSMGMFEYCQAAEPPDPDEGDWVAKPAV
jgi:hypothetical protein